MLKKGPEIKVPDFLLDLYYDLRERHLLPLAAVLVVAIVAAPIVLSQSNSEDPETAASPGSVAATAATASSRAGVLVARSAPGLREYRRRLRHMHAKDPFEQQYTEEESEGQPAESVSTGAPETGGSSESGGSSEVPATPAPSPTVPTPGGESSPGPGKLTYYSYAIDVRVVTGGSQDGGKGSGEATVRRNLPELTMLPSRDTPAAIYMGSTKDGKKALMLVSSNVSSIFGDGKCVLGSDRCELLAMEPGVPETFVYGGAGRTFKIELLKVHLVATDKLNRAPLGKPKQKGKSKKGGQGQFRQR